MEKAPELLIWKTGPLMCGTFKSGQMFCTTLSVKNLINHSQILCYRAHQELVGKWRVLQCNFVQAVTQLQSVCDQLGCAAAVPSSSEYRHLLHSATGRFRRSGTAHVLLQSVRSSEFRIQAASSYCDIKNPLEVWRCDLGAFD